MPSQTQCFLGRLDWLNSAKIPLNDSTPSLVQVTPTKTCNDSKDTLKDAAADNAKQTIFTATIYLQAGICDSNSISYMKQDGVGNNIMPSTLPTSFPPKNFPAPRRDIVKIHHSVALALEIASNKFPYTETEGGLSPAMDLILCLSGFLMTDGSYIDSHVANHKSELLGQESEPKDESSNIRVFREGRRVGYPGQGKGTPFPAPGRGGVQYPGSGGGRTVPTFLLPVKDVVDRLVPQSVSPYAVDHNYPSSAYAMSRRPSLGLSLRDRCADVGPHGPIGLDSTRAYHFEARTPLKSSCQPVCQVNPYGPRANAGAGLRRPESLYARAYATGTLEPANVLLDTGATTTLISRSCLDNFLTWEFSEVDQFA